MNRALVAAACGVLALSNIGFAILEGAAERAVTDGTMPLLFDSLGTSVVLYTSVIGVLGVLVPAGLAAALGYWAVGRVDGPRVYRRLGRTTAAGSVGGLLAVFLTLAVVNGALGSLAYLAVSVVSMVVENAVIVVVSVLAGAALGSEEPVWRSGASESAAEAAR